MTELAKALTLKDVVGLTIGSVVGSGLLVLPGLVHQVAGADALIAWILMAVFAIPLICIFSELCSKYPSAGGMAGFARKAFGSRMEQGMVNLLAGTFPIGIPALAIIGANYVSYALNLGRVETLIMAFLILLFVTLVHLRGNRLGSRFQNYSALFLTLFLVLVSILVFPQSLARVHRIQFYHDPQLIWYSMGLLFWAFMGWENMSFTSEEFSNPRRDFPLGLAVSFLLVTGLYLLISFNVALLLDPYDPMTGRAPIAEVIRVVFGHTAGVVVAGLGLLIILVNASAWVWGASRLVFAGAREGYLPAFLRHVHLRTQAPDRSLIVLLFTYGLVILLVGLFQIPLENLILVVNVNTLLAYIVSIGAFIKVNGKHPFKRILGGLALVLSLVFMAIFNYAIIYALTLILLPFISSWIKAMAGKGRTGDR